MRQICKNASDAHFAETGRRISLAHNTLARHGKGGVTLTQSNQQKSWLTAEEEENVINFAIEIAQRGFPLSPRRLKEHCEAVLRHRLGKNFPERGLGRDWGNRFITKHHSRLGMYWSSALDSSRGRAVNPVTKEEYFRILKEAREKGNIPDMLVYGADETGIQAQPYPLSVLMGHLWHPPSFTREKLSKRSGYKTIPWMPGTIQASRGSWSSS